jgi:hypothetical protein
MAEGYLFIDHRASPGLSEEVAKKAGYDPFLCREGKVFEAATKACRHCRSVVIMNPERKRVRNYCVKCSNGYICDLCAEAMRQPGYVHAPFEKLVDIAKDCEAKGVTFNPTKILRP